MNKKVKKALKWTGIGIGVLGAGVGAYALVAYPEVRIGLVNGAKKGCTLIASPFKDKTVAETLTETPRREGRNSGGYYKPRYNNNKKH